MTLRGSGSRLALEHVMRLPFVPKPADHAADYADDNAAGRHAKLDLPGHATSGFNARLNYMHERIGHFICPSEVNNC